MRTPALLPMLCLASLATAAPARADSDGYYCVGPDYLAYELRSFNTPGLVGEHVLRVVRFGPDVTLLEVEEVVLEDFQTHEMACGSDRVRIGGWSEMPVEYEVALDDGPRIVRHSRFPGREFVPPQESPSNLGNWMRPGIVPLPSTDPRYAHRLVLSDSPRDGAGRGGGIHHRFRAELQRLDPTSGVAASLVLYEGEMFEPVH